MKKLFNNISQEEKNRILEMHSGKNNLISEQNSQQVYKEIADNLYNSMKGLSSSEDSKKVESIILNRIKNINDWEGVNKAFGVRDGENLEQWLKGELRLDYNQIISNLIRRGVIPF
jgi:polygalacturonase